MPKKSGFTVLELIVCLIIISVVATTAMMRFMEIQADARASKIREVAANLRYGIDVIHTKSILAGVEKECDYTIKTEVESYFVCFGYPIAYIDSIRRLMNMPKSRNEDPSYRLDVKNIDIHKKHPSTTNPNELVAAIHFVNQSYTFFPEDGYCQVLYQPEREPQIIVLDSAC
ncbi:type II secretion system GspH family protein [Vibrio pelagius]|uniref:Type II secretion system GspH family protein n=1 Tax=Vibrio pelagius TaxID=28169 RepID=A0ABY5G965_VIBPE|nr:type II secretion system protein [Vibrio pelagius]UTT86718.1 type II secretion system GspH family protein [Vibrio pelagius]